MGNDFRGVRNHMRCHMQGKDWHARKKTSLLSILKNGDQASSEEAMP